MTHTYQIKGMTCNHCIAKVKSELLKIGDITALDVKLEAPQATITMHHHVPVETLQSAIDKAGNFSITEANAGIQHAMIEENERSWFDTYKPLLVVFSYITGITVLIEIVNVEFLWMRWMQNFMAAFFLVFSFFKLLDIKGFAESYFSYDIIAKRWMGWGYTYAFIELGLGLAYLLRFDLLVTSIVTLMVMSISIIGVLQSVINKRKIKCACLGAVFNLPMSTITIIEDALMIGMSAFMIWHLAYS